MLRLLAGVIALSWATAASANDISILNAPGGLYSTGIAGSTYTYQFVPDSPALSQTAGNTYPTSGTAVTATPGIFPLNYYTSGNATGSQWVLTRSNNVSGDFSDLNGHFILSTTFTAPAGAHNVSVAGQVAADNRIEKILLNGADTGFAGGSFSDPGNGFPFAAFNINGGIHSGMNTLSFVVWNDPQTGGNPVGLNVNLSQATVTYSLSSLVETPEPATLAVVGGLALAGLGAWRRKRAA